MTEKFQAALYKELLLNQKYNTLSMFELSEKIVSMIDEELTVILIQALKIGDILDAAGLQITSK